MIFSHMARQYEKKCRALSVHMASVPIVSVMCYAQNSVVTVRDFRFSSKTHYYWFWSIHFESLLYVA